MRKKRVSKGNNLHSQHDILDGLAQVFRVKQSGDVFQFRMYIKEEQKHYRKSLRTKDLEELCHNLTQRKVNNLQL